MTVKEMKKILKKYDDDTEILIKTKGKVVNGFPAKALYCHFCLDEHVVAQKKFLRLKTDQWQYFDL